MNWRFFNNKPTYMERPIWSPDDEKIMPLGRPVPRSHQSDRSKAVRPVEIVRDGSCILTRDMFGFRLLWVQTFSSYLYEGSWPIEGIPINSTHYPLHFIPKPYLFQSHVVLSSSLRRLKASWVACRSQGNPSSISSDWGPFRARGSRFSRSSLVYRSDRSA